jgi:hypothetical protein
MPSPVAERVRIHRKMRRNGLRYVRVLLHETEIDTLVRDGYLKAGRRHLKEAVQSALNSFVVDRLGLPPAEDRDEL